MTHEEMQALMVEAGPLGEDILAVLEIEQGMWTFRFPDFDVDLVNVPEESRLVMTTTVAAPPPDRAAAVHRLLLVYNAIWQDTGSVRAAIASTEGEIALLCDVFTGDLDAELVARMATNLAAKAASWKAIIEAGAPDGGDIASGSDTVFRI